MRYINKTRFFILTVILTLLFSILISYAKNVSHDISKSVVRLHIIANSDTDTDQSLKIKVRDRLLKESNRFFANAESTTAALSLAKENCTLIKQIAENEITSCGFNYPVTVKIGKFPFPTKAYGDIMLPSGRYNAVRIEIGEAKGQNWWCVMYPPLCITDGILAVSGDAKNKLKNSLSESEYNLITKNPSGKIPVEVRFKIVEIFSDIFTH